MREKAKTEKKKNIVVGVLIIVKEAQHVPVGDVEAGGKVQVQL